MAEPVFNYDEASDTLYISFGPGREATGIELSDHILLRIDKDRHKAVGLTFFEYSLLAQRTEMGPRSSPLTGLVQLSEELQELVLDILREPPVSDILFLSSYTPSLQQATPIMSLRSLTTAAAVAAA